MSNKLTLRLDKELIDRAKKHAKQQGTSVSKLVANYFEAIDSTPRDGSNKKLPPITQSLAGVLEVTDITKEDYQEYLEKKHQ
ncbi:MAG: hypothetical protein JJ966_14540 [Balneolaceae bacterium]|nr:hypothetical protein [Balneolaceae bacterium]